jgi:hypothetical protein
MVSLRLAGSLPRRDVLLQGTGEDGRFTHIVDE